MSLSKYDAIIVGGGHNGLVCACYLARAGLKVRVLERRGVVGGAAVTEEFHPGTAYVLLHHVVGEVNGKRGAWGHAIGGMGAITQAMAREARSLGVEISTGAPVSEVLVENARVRGALLATGEAVHAPVVAANVNPKLLYLTLLPAAALEEEFRQRMQRYVCASATFRMNVALSELPDFTCLPGRQLQPHHQSGIVMAPSLDYLDRAHTDARRLGWSRQPFVEMLIPSTVDDTLAPPGQHVASLFCQHFNPKLPAGRSWDDARDEAADLIIETVNQHAPNFKSSVLGRMVLSPLDLERKLGLVGGDIFHGALRLNQLFSARPLLGHADYRGPVQGLYLCGSGAHPGGAVTGIPGHNAAREMLRDRRWLTP